MKLVSFKWRTLFFQCISLVHSMISGYLSVVSLSNAIIEFSVVEANNISDKKLTGCGVGIF